MSALKISLRESIADHHTQLNCSDIVPPHCYRRNKVHYDLVSYVNNIIGLYLSKNYEVIPVFIGRAARHMEEFPAGPESMPYYQLASRYLELVAGYMVTQGISLDDFVPETLIAVAQGMSKPQ